MLRIIVRCEKLLYCELRQTFKYFFFQNKSIHIYFLRDTEVKITQVDEPEN